MRASDRPAVVLRYYLYRATSHSGFHYPIYTLFLLHNHLTFTQIGAIASIQSIVVVTGEVPTGYIGDRVGRRNSLAIASVLFLVSNASYLVATDFVGFTFTFVALSLGGTFVSGSASAWLYDTLEEHDISGEYTHVAGRAGAISKWVGAASMVAGGLLYTMNVYYPFVAGVALGVVNLALVLALPKNAQYADRPVPSGTADAADGPVEGPRASAEGTASATDGPTPPAAETGPSDDRSTDSNASDPGDDLTIVTALPLIREQLSKPSMRWFIVYMALFGGALMTADMYIQPIARDALRTSIGPTLNSWGIAEAATLGVLYAAFTAISAVVSDYAGDVEDRFGVRSTLVLIPLGIAFLYLLPPLVPLLAFPMFFVMKGGFTLVWPVSSRYMNDRIDSVGRATVLSVASMLRAVAGIPFRIASGVVADHTTTMLAVAALGATFIVSAVALVWFAEPVRAGTETASPAD